ncbi:rhodanese-like domain-containing protein [Pirellulaceae bacterium SH449]
MTTGTFANISPHDLKDWVSQPGTVHVIDVRTAPEFQEVHLEAATNVPLDKLRAESLPSDGKPIVFVCKSGTRGRTAAEKASQHRQNVFNVEGGTDACVAANLPVIRGKKAISLERQVRIAAGSLVLTGVALAYLIHPACILLSAFVGAGLVFAGVTDTCGMAILLGKMPWNQCPLAPSSASQKLAS